MKTPPNTFKKVNGRFSSVKIQNNPTNKGNAKICNKNFGTPYFTKKKGNKINIKIQ